MIVIGNVVFFKQTNTFISRVIANITNSKFTHVGLIVAYDDKSRVATIIESDRFVNTRINRIKLDDKRHVVYSVDMTDEVRDRVVKFAFKSLGTGYDYIQIVGLFFSLTLGGRLSFFNSKNKFICSELIDLAYYKAGVSRKNIHPIGDVTPQELLEVYELKDVRKGL